MEIHRLISFFFICLREINDMVKTYIHQASFAVSKCRRSSTISSLRGQRSSLSSIRRRLPTEEKHSHYPVVVINHLRLFKELTVFEPVISESGRCSHPRSQERWRPRWHDCLQSRRQMGVSTAEFNHLYHQLRMSPV